MDDNEGTTSTNGVYRTDNDGQISIRKLEPGVYTITETKAPQGYTLDSQTQTVTVNVNDSHTITFRDDPLQNLTIIKYEAGTTNPLAGVTFSVTDEAGNPVGNGTYTTDENGQIRIGGLMPGMNVVVREIRTVRGYVLNGAPQMIRITAGGANSVTSGSAATGTGTAGTATATGTGTGTSGGNTLTFYDEPLSVLLIRKYVDGTDNQPLPSVEFTITDGRGAAVGNGNGVYYTDNAGEIRLENLEPGVSLTVRAG